MIYEINSPCVLSGYKHLRNFSPCISIKQPSIFFPLMERYGGGCFLSVFVFTLNLGWNSQWGSNYRGVEWIMLSPSRPVSGILSPLRSSGSQLLFVKWSAFQHDLHINFWQRLFIRRERHIFETIERVFVKLKLNTFFLCLILAIFPEQGMKEGINLKFGLP